MRKSILNKYCLVSLPSSFFWAKPFVCICVPKIYFSKTVNLHPTYITPYRLSKPLEENRYLDDLILSRPDQKKFGKFVKDITTFLDYLKQVTNQEKRKSDYLEFLEKYAKGLEVEKSIYITKNELLKNMWENGYSEVEMNELDNSFPSTYEFHYPELAILFNLSEDDCYKYCLGTRTFSENNFAELKAPKKIKYKILSYCILSTGIWSAMQTNIFGNMWFFIKTWPFLAVFYIINKYYKKEINKLIYDGPLKESQIVKENKLDGEDSVYKKLQKLKEHIQYYDHLFSFHSMCKEQMTYYKKALLHRHRHQVYKSISNYLTNLASDESALTVASQKIIANKIMDKILYEIRNNKSFREQYLDWCLQHLENNKCSQQDPLLEYIRDLLHAIQNPGQNEKMSDLIREIDSNFESNYNNFLKRYFVTSEEIECIKKKILLICDKNNQLDFEKLSTEDRKELNHMIDCLFKKTGCSQLFQSLHDSMNDIASNDISPMVIAKMENQSQALRDTIEKAKIQFVLKQFI